MKFTGNEKEYQRLYYQKNKAKWLVYKDKWVKNNPEKDRESKLKYKAKNKEKTKAYNKQWSQKNSGKVTAYARAYQLAKQCAMPKWLTEDQLKQIEQMYINRPDGYHVDHIIPLKGKLVSGLHVPWNLQYLRAAQNISKSNKI